MDKIVFEDLPSTTTTVDADNLNTIQNNIETAINKKIDFVNLLTVNNTAPSTCVTGDKYYNTTNKLIYIATGTNTWDTVGEIPIQNCLYIDNEHKVLFIYNGIDLEVYNVTEKNIMTATITSNYTISASNTYETLALNRNVSVGNKLTLSTQDSAIVIGDNVSKVLVSAKASYQGATSGLKWVTVFLNNNGVMANPTTISSDRITISGSQTLVNVRSGDKIYLKVNGNSGDVIRSSEAYTNITVEVVN